jgi:hypothetical protein
MNIVRCSKCRNFQPDPEIPGWGHCDERNLPNLKPLGLVNPRWWGESEIDCAGFEEAKCDCS